MVASRTTTDRPAGAATSAERGIVEFALRAPSVHNTQPWRWCIDAQRLDLYADRARQLLHADPSGRNLTISCGAALEYAVVGAAAAGWSSAVELVTDGDAPDHLATVRLSAAEPSWRAAADARSLSARTTDRRRFIPWPVSVPLLQGLAEACAVGTAWAAPVVDVVGRCHLELLASRAISVVRGDPRLVEEERTWVVEGGHGGVPGENARPADIGLPHLWPSRYDPSPSTTAESRLLAASTDGLLVILTAADDRRSWLDSGRLLCRLWAAAMDRGLSLVPLSVVVEVAETRAGLQRDVLRTEAHPQLVLRLGWQELGRSALPPTPRRGIDEVLIP